MSNLPNIPSTPQPASKAGDDGRTRVVLRFAQAAEQTPKGSRKARIAQMREQSAQHNARFQAWLQDHDLEGEVEVIQPAKYTPYMTVSSAPEALKLLTQAPDVLDVIADAPIPIALDDPGER